LSKNVHLIFDNSGSGDIVEEVSFRNKPLSGINVIDLSTSYAGPFCSMLLGDLGATVIKVEKLNGDDSRNWGPPFIGGESAWFLSVNRNKKSIGLDIAKKEGRSLLDGLLAGADVFIENLKPVSLVRFGLTHEAIAKRFPHIVYAAISGFGLTGPDSNRTGYDLIAQAMSGIMSVTGGSDGEPQRVGTALSDIVTGITAALGICAKLVDRAASGNGGLVDVSLLDVDVALMGPRIVSYLASGDLPLPNGGIDSVISIYQKVETQDAPIVVATGTEALWRKFKDALGEPEELNSPDYDTNASRQAHRAELITKVERILKQKSSKEWEDTLSRYGVPVAKINSLEDVVVEEQIIARGMLRELQHSVAGPITLVGSPIHIDGYPLEISKVPPVLGEDTFQLLRDLGLSDQRIRDLIAEQVIAGVELSATTEGISDGSK
jgi:crotonobetainyl-CoA:carnitine CoA-transferase CaiB-like acyl-CoA transferase